MSTHQIVYAKTLLVWFVLGMLALGHAFGGI